MPVGAVWNSYFVPCQCCKSEHMPRHIAADKSIFLAALDVELAPSAASPLKYYMVMKQWL